MSKQELSDDKKILKRESVKEGIFCLLTWRKDDPSEGWIHQYPSSPDQAD
jgi:hypothetical protein